MWCRQCKSPTTGNLSSECSLKNVPSASRFSLTAKLGLLYRCFWVTQYFSEWFPFLDFLLPPTFPSISDAVSHVVSVLCVLWLFSAALYHRCKGQTHQRHGVSSLLGAWHQWPRTPQQLLLHPGYPGRQANKPWKEWECLSSLWLLHCHLVNHNYKACHHLQFSKTIICIFLFLLCSVVFSLQSFSKMD